MFARLSPGVLRQRSFVPISRLYSDPAHGPIIDQLPGSLATMASDPSTYKLNRSWTVLQHFSTQSLTQWAHYRHDDAGQRSAAIGGFLQVPWLDLGQQD